MTKTYREKLMDPRWQKKRLLIFERDKWACVRCGSTTNNLQVHHKKYTGEPWEAPDNDLETICDVCHKAEHNIADARYEKPVQVEEVIIRLVPGLHHFVGDERYEYVKEWNELYDKNRATKELLKDTTISDERLFEILGEIKVMETRLMNMRKEFYAK